jgi:hypothetical protein
MAPSDVGKYYWCAKVTQDLSDDGEIYVYADDVVIADGAVVFLRDSDGKRHPNLVVPAGKWIALFAASVFDGHAVAVEHWAGEVVER